MSSKQVDGLWTGHIRLKSPGDIFAASQTIPTSKKRDILLQGVVLVKYTNIAEV